jgi:hypothetical protein
LRGDIRRVLALCVGMALAGFACAPNKPAILTSDPAASTQEDQPSRKLDIYIESYVTGYNTVAQQTDDTPCIAASGSNICGRADAVACPPLLKLGTAVEINGKKYLCEDRTAPKFRDRFDINCDKDKSCPYRVAGWKSVKVLLD